MPSGAVENALECDRIFIFEEGMRSGGVAEKFASLLLEKGYKGGYSITAVDDEFVAHASVSRLMEKYSMDADGMASKIEKEV